MFLQVSVILFTGGPGPSGVPGPKGGSCPGGVLGPRGRACLVLGDLVPGGAWWRPPRRLLLRAVRILLECILVVSKIVSNSCFCSHFTTITTSTNQRYLRRSYIMVARRTSSISHKYNSAQWDPK